MKTMLMYNHMSLAAFAVVSLFVATVGARSISSQCPGPQLKRIDNFNLAQVNGKWFIVYCIPVGYHSKLPIKCITRYLQVNPPSGPDAQISANLTVEYLDTQTNEIMCMFGVILQDKEIPSMATIESRYSLLSNRTHYVVELSYDYVIWLNCVGIGDSGYTIVVMTRTREVDEQMKAKISESLRKAGFPDLTNEPEVEQKNCPHTTSCVFP